MGFWCLLVFVRWGGPILECWGLRVLRVSGLGALMSEDPPGLGSWGAGFQVFWVFVESLLFWLLQSRDLWVLAWALSIGIWEVNGVLVMAFWVLGCWRFGVWKGGVLGS